MVAGDRTLYGKSEVDGPLVTARIEGSWVLLSHAEQVRLELAYDARDPVLGLQFSIM